MVSDYGHWKIDEITEFDPDQYHGFVYLISNLRSDKHYIGSKVFRHKITRPALKGKKRKRISYIESDWKTYTGSSNKLNADIAMQGIQDFHFLIISLHKNSRSLKMAEAQAILNANAIDSNHFYNCFLQLKVGYKQA